MEFPITGPFAQFALISDQRADLGKGQCVLIVTLGFYPVLTPLETLPHVDLMGFEELEASQ